MKSLSLIVSETALLEQKIIEAGGEITPEIEALLVVNEAELMDKVDSYNFIIERFDAYEEFYKQRADMFYSISSRCKSAREILKNNILLAMERLGKKEIQGEDFRFALVKSKASVVIEDEKLIPEDYKTKVITEKVDKSRLSADLQMGPIPGAKLQEGFHLRAFVNSLKKIAGKKDE